MMLCNTNPTARWGLLAATLSLLMAGALYAQPQVRQIADINTIADSDAALGGMTEFNGELYFAADDYVHGVELWKTDGTNASLVKDINPNGDGITYAWFTEYNGKLYFVADNGTDGPELWYTDGTELGTDMVNINQNATQNGSDGSDPKHLCVFNGALYFAANGGNGEGEELWKTDGTTTSRVYDISSGPTSSGPEWLTEYDGELYFSAEDFPNAFGREIYKMDTAENVSMAYNINDTGSFASSTPTYLCVYDNKLYMRATEPTNGRELWVYDSQNQTQPMSSFDTLAGGDGNPGLMTVFNNELFFSVNASGGGTDLWKLNGTTAPGLFSNIDPVVVPSWPNSMVEYNGMLYFTATGGTTGIELWRTDGTNQPTLVHDIDTNGDGEPAGLTVFNGKLYFGANTPLTGYELWRTDGTTLELAHDINKGGNGVGTTAEFVELGGYVYFPARQTSTEPYAIWRCGVDGSDVEKVTVTESVGTPKNFHVYGEDLYFTGQNQTSVTNCWRYNPTQGVLDEIVVSAGAVNGEVEFVEFDGKLYFVSDDSTGGAGDASLYEYDPDSAQLTKIDVYASGTNGLTHPAVLGDRLFFFAFNPTLGYKYELLYYTPSASVNVVTTASGGLADIRAEIVPVENGLCFFGDDGNGIELWHVELPSEAATKITGSFDINAGVDLMSVAGRAYFVANDSTGDEELHGFNPLDGTVTKYDVNISGSSYSYGYELLGSRLYFTAEDASGNENPWYLDIGTEQLHQVVDFSQIIPAGWGAPQYFVRIGNGVAFRASNGQDDESVWFYDEKAGTVELIADSFDDLGQLHVFQNHMFFTASIPGTGEELWVVSVPSGGGSGGDDDSGCSAKQGGRPAIFILIAALFAIALVTRRKHTRQMAA